MHTLLILLLHWGCKEDIGVKIPKVLNQEVEMRI